jgi:hypothetical protein
MFKFTIDPTLNAAFEDDRGHEVARILREIADRVEVGHEYGVAHDINGNTVGSWRFDDDDDARAERTEAQRERFVATYDDLVATAGTLVDEAGDPASDDALEQWESSDVLSHDVKHVHHVLLSMNGPTEYVEIDATTEGAATAMSWIATYGEVTVTRPIADGSPLWVLMARAAGVEA